MGNRIELTPSRQCYLAEILSLEMERGRARQSKIAERIDVTRSSVTAALRLPADHGFARYEPYGGVVLTPKGRLVADQVLARRRIIRDYLVSALDIPIGSAQQAARLMQSTVPDLIIDRFADELGPG